MANRLVKLISVAGCVLLAACSTGGGDSAKPTTDCSIDHLPKEINVGVDLPLTGSVARTGNDAKAGMETARAYVEQNILSGHAFKMNYLDDAFEKQRVLVNVQRLLDRDIDVLLGPLGSPVANAALPIPQQRGVPTIALAVPSESTLKIGANIFFSAGSVGTDGPAALVRALREAGLPMKRPVIALEKEYAAGVEFFAGIRTELQKAGIPVAAEVNFKAGMTDYSAEVTAVTAARPDIVFADGSHPSLPIFVKQLRESGNAAPVVGQLGTSVPTFPETAGKAAANGVIGLAYWVPGAQGETALSAQFVAAYKRQHGGNQPTQYFSTGADTVLALGHALAACKSTHPEDLRRSLAKVKPFEGVEGDRISFRPNRVIAIEPRAFIWKNGQLVPLTTANRGG
jgi:branched-chain amino acid transport system substrate-binding protein